MKIGIIGFGFMGQTHFKAWNSLDNIEITICDSNPDLPIISGNIGENDFIDIGTIKVYKDFDKMIKENELDAVSITLPTPLHAEYSVKALNKGIHVLCEKPMALNIDDCNRMIETAEKNNKILQIAHCIRFWPEYVKVKEIIQTNVFGDVIAATFRRLGSIPEWGNNNWFFDDNKTGGIALDLHIHDTDFVNYLFGIPKAVFSTGGYIENNGKKSLNHINTQFIYNDKKTVSAEGSWAMKSSFGFEMSFNIVLENATLIFNSIYDNKLKIFPEEGDAFYPELEPGDGYTREIEYFYKIINGEKVEKVISPLDAMEAVRISEAEKNSIKKGEKVFL